MTIQFDAVHEKLVVATSIDQTAVAKALGSRASLLDYRSGKAELLVGRSTDSSPFNGAAKIKFDGDPPNSWCTSGFTVTNGFERAMLIPAHCGDINTKARTWAGVEIGSTGTDRHCGPVSQDGDNSDFQFVRGKSYTDNIYLGQDPGFLADVIDYGTPAIGAAYRYSGATTYESAAIEVVSDLDAEQWNPPNTSCVDDGWWTTHLIAFSSDAHCDAQPGDSGGPFFARQGTNPIQARLRGMVVGRLVTGGNNIGPYCYAIKISIVESLSSYHPITTN